MSNRHEMRDKVLDVFMRDVKGLDETQIRDLEIGIYNASLDYANENNIVLNWENSNFCDVYINKARSVYTNLTDSYIKNVGLINKIKNNELLPHEVAGMKSEEMFPERWNDILTRTRDKFKNAYEITNVMAMTNRFVCKRCKSRKITYYDQMTRSADEAITTFYQCQECNYKWRN